MREHRGCKARYGAQWGKRFDETRVVRPGYRGELGGEEVGSTELASKFCPLASCSCRWPTRFIKYPVRVISNLTPVRNDQSTVESPNGINYSAKGTTHYSTKFGPVQGPNDKLRKLTLSTC